MSTAPKRAPKAELTVYEYSSGREKLRVDREAAVIYGVKVLGRRSVNGRVYPEAAMRAAVPLYEGAKVNVGHPPKNEPGRERLYDERIGNIRNVEVREGELYGNFHYNPKHRLAEQLAWDAENAPENVGFSHHANVRASNKGGTQVVEAITKIVSVDLVADPATTKGLYESVDPTHKETTMVDTSLLTLESVRERNDIIEAIIREHNEGEAVKREVAELKSLREMKAVFESTAEELKTLKKRVDEYEAKEAAAQLQAEVMEDLLAAKLDPADETKVSKVFLGSLYECTDRAARKALIADRAEIFRTVKPQAVRPRSVQQDALESRDNFEPVDGKAVAARYTAA